jgi:L-ribulose-5-phosphate 3-epimerase
MLRPIIGCCSWSLRPEDPGDLAAKLREVGVAHVQLALEPLRSGAWDVMATRAALQDAGISIVSGMMAMEGEDYSTLDSIRRTGGVRRDETWEQNLAAARDVALLAGDLGIELVTFHAGFLPHDVDDPERAKLLSRLRSIFDCFARRGVHVGLETGQETAGTLLSVLRELDRGRAGVNFDPANMILYDMGDPVAALEKLAPYVKQLHFKDAIRSRTRGEWGEEVKVGSGEVDWNRLLEVVERRNLPQAFLFEREAGDERIADLRDGIAYLGSLLEARNGEG